MNGWGFVLRGGPGRQDGCEVGGGGPFDATRLMSARPILAGGMPWSDASIKYIKSGRDRDLDKRECPGITLGLQRPTIQIYLS